MILIGFCGGGVIHLKDFRVRRSPGMGIDRPSAIPGAAARDPDCAHQS